MKGCKLVNNYTVTVKMPEDAQLRAVGKKASSFTLIIENGWATFGGKADTPEDFELDLLENIEGLPNNIKAVESW